MKNLFKIIGIIALVTIIGFVMVSCGGGKIPNGKYLKGESYWEFSGNKATYYAHANFIQKGTYTIDKDGLFNFVKEDGSIEKKYSLLKVNHYCLEALLL